MLSGTPEYLAAHLRDLGASVPVPGVESASSLAKRRTHLSEHVEVRSPAGIKSRWRLAGFRSPLHRLLRAIIG